MYKIKLIKLYKHIIVFIRLKCDYASIQNQNQKLTECNEKYKALIFDLQKKIKWYEQFVKLENERFENLFSNKLNKLFTPTQIQLLLNPKKKKVYKWTPEDISSAISLRSVSPKSYRFLRTKKNFPLPGEQFSTMDKLTVLCFDETYISNRICFDKQNEQRVHFEILALYDEHIKQNSISNHSRKRPLDQSSTIDLYPRKQPKLSFCNKKDKQKELDKNIMRYIVLGMRPVSTVEDENFIKIIKGIDNDLQITPNTLKRGNCVLSYRRMTGKHSYDHIADLFQDIFNKFSLLREQIVSIVTDNGSNFVKAFKEFGYDIQDMRDDIDYDDEEDEDDRSNEQTIFLPHHLRCASHTLSLIATTDFSKAVKNSSINRLHNGAIGKCTTLWNMSRRPKSSEIIHDLIGCSLFYPCPTRWNSLYDALSQLLKFKDKLNIIFQHLNVNTSFKDIELVYLDELIILLKPIACALDCLQA
ncbi:Uncharacterized protein FWK35_00011207 [Aphis craccivora]|uniref:Uncharacterized protein n=1 Tax=Aphis craccivora TaxID=307492 RepID=A0A6G0YLZ1_APHCR|nr:Uncharacterized protein FWK35_00011207 [Aphis craccivora]